MKNQLFLATLGLCALAPVAAVHAQQTVVTTQQPTTVTTVQQPVAVQTTETNMAGTVTSFTPGSSQIVVKTASGPATYNYTKKTTFVDASGNIVSYESIKAGDPTTVYYTTVDGQPVVSKVVVNRTAPAAVTKTETTETTTTTTSKH